MTEDWEQVPCKTCKGEGWVLKPPDYDDGPRCHWCGGYGKLTYAKGDKMDALTIVKQFASFVLQYWPSISSVAVGGLSSVIAGSWAPILSAIAGIAIGKVSAKPVAAIRARLAKRAA